MSTEVVMPQMGESIAEGTITRWLKKVGERVERDEPLFEISTDKVDAEIPSPAEGVLTKVLFNEGDVVEVNTVVAILNGDDAAAAPTETKASAPAPVAEEKPAEKASKPAPPVAQPPQTPPTTPPATQSASAAKSEDANRGAESSVPPANEVATKADTSDKPRGEMSAEELRKTRSSPLVRNIAKEHGIDISGLEGTGLSGRVTRNDIMSFIESGAAMTPQQAMQPQAKITVADSPSTERTVPAPAPATGDRVEQMSVMRKKIAEHMVLSRRTSAHVTTVYEIDMTGIVRLRNKQKDAFLQNVGTKLTFMPYVFQAVTSAIRQFPVFNSQVSGDQIIYKQEINLGMAVALDWGLIVPVIKRADELSIAGLARAANDLAERARSKQLKPADVAGGTFTITNPGVFGGLFGTPIINQPQVAILGVGAIVKRPMVVTTEDGDDQIAIRHMAYFALTFDHRVIDGSDAERFLGFIKRQLENARFVA